MTEVLDLSNVANMTDPNFIRTLEKQLAAQRKSLEDAYKGEQAEYLHTFVENTVTSQEPATSEKSAWVGYRVSAIPVHVDGVEYSVSVTITDVACKVAREKVLADAEKAKKADAEKADNDNA